MDYSKENQNWDSLSYVEKNHQLYLKQKALLDQFLEKGAISQAQHDKSLHDLIEKMDKKAREQRQKGKAPKKNRGSEPPAAKK
jgi:polyhydroxyalkanoate synthesis regulator phasin